MQKVLAFLEKNVQWVAIGLGGIYMLFMVWTYVINNPAKVAIPGAGDAHYSPGDVDRIVYNGSADKLQREMDSSRTVALPNPKYDQILNDILNPAPMPALAANWSTSPTTPQVIDPNNGLRVPNAPGQQPIQPIEVLPVASAPLDILWCFGRSNVTVPPQQPQVAAGPNGVPVQPVIAQPLQPGQGINVDKDWVTVQFRLPMQELAKQFEQAKIQTQFRTCILQIELLRQEMDANGVWGKETVIAPLDSLPIMQFPTPPNNNKGNQGAYLAWAQQNPIAVTQPPFYPVTKGESWHLPGAPAQMVGAPQQGVAGPLGPNDVRPGFDPNGAMTQDPRTFNPPLTLKEKQLISKAKADKQRMDAAQRAQQRGQQRNTGPRGGGRGGGMEGESGPGYAPNDPGRPASPTPYQNRPGPQTPPGSGYRPGGIPPNANQYRPAYDPTMPPEEAGMEGEGMPGMQQGPVPGNQNVQGMYPLPQGDFDPRLLMPGAQPPPGAPPQQPLPQPAPIPQGMMVPPPGDLVGWAHDATVQPGKTYRYRVRYHLKNPVWNSNVAAKNLASQFDIVSPESNWTTDIHIPLQTQFFVTSVSPAAPPTATVDVFRWQDGVLRFSSFRVAPGDLVGKAMNNVDYATGFTVVDVRPGGGANNDPYVVLMDAEGNLLRRDFKADANNPDFARLKQQAQQAQAMDTNPALAGRGPGG
jgi:hypothetical protein